MIISTGISSSIVSIDSRKISKYAIYKRNKRLDLCDSSINLLSLTFLRIERIIFEKTHPKTRLWDSVKFLKSLLPQNQLLNSIFGFESNNTNHSIKLSE